MQQNFEHDLNVRTTPSGEVLIEGINTYVADELGRFDPEDIGKSFVAINDVRIAIDLLSDNYNTLFGNKPETTEPEKESARKALKYLVESVSDLFDEAYNAAVDEGIYDGPKVPTTRVPEV